MPRQTYHTVGKEALSEFLRRHPDCQFSAEELCQAINGTATTGKSSVYRQLTFLCERDVVRRFRSEERNCNVYQYVGDGCDCGLHFHAKCTVCGSISHLDCAESTAFAAHLLEEHGFSVNCGQSVLYGLCAACRAASGKEDGANA